MKKTVVNRVTLRSPTTLEGGFKIKFYYDLLCLSLYGIALTAVNNLNKLNKCSYMDRARDTLKVVSSKTFGKRMSFGKRVAVIQGHEVKLAEMLISGYRVAIHVLKTPS